MKRLYIQLEQKAHLRAKVIAAIKGVSLNDYVAQAISKNVGRKLKT